MKVESADEKPWSIMRRTASGSVSVVAAASARKNSAAIDLGAVAQHVGRQTPQRLQRTPVFRSSLCRLGHGHA
jgi:hypothetical protein